MASKSRRRQKAAGQGTLERRYITVAQIYGASDRGETMRIDLVVDAEEAGL